MIEEIVLAAIVDGVFGYVLEQSGVADKLKEKLKLDPTRRAFEHALRQTCKWFAEQYPTWTDSLLRGFFSKREGQQILAQFLTPDGRPNPSNVAVQWADFLAINDLNQRTPYARQLEPIASELLSKLAHELKIHKDLAELTDSRALDGIAKDIQALRQKLDADKATPATRRDYLHWLIDDNLYLDPRGTQTVQRVSVKLEDVYVSLRVERDETFNEADRLLREKELTELEKKLEHTGLSAEEIEEQRDSLLDSWHRRALRGNTQESPVELAKLVQRHDRVVILGDPGSGKSTLLRHLALTYAQQLIADAQSEQRFPILIRISQYVQDGRWKSQSLSDFLADYYRLRECPHNGLADLLERVLARGNCLVMLDGLDEIVSADERRGVAGKIDGFVRRHAEAGNHFIVTSRKAGYRNASLGGAFEHYTLQDMDDEQIKGFLMQWCLAVERAQAPDRSIQVCHTAAQQEISNILRAIQMNPGVRRMAGNPLLLRNLALIQRDRAHLPEKRIELYKYVADILARDWRIIQGVPETALVRPEWLNPMLGELAFWIHENKPTGLATENEVYDVLGHAWERLNDDEGQPGALKPETVSEVSNFLERVRQHTGLFVERAPKRYGFMHQTFQEYYAALYLATRRGVGGIERAKMFRSRLHDPRWQEVLLLSIGFVGVDYPDEATALIRSAVLAEGAEAKSFGFEPSEDEDLLGRDFLFALRCLADQINVKPKLVRDLTAQAADEISLHSKRANFEQYNKKLSEATQLLKGSRAADELCSQLLERFGNSKGLACTNILDALGQIGQRRSGVIEVLLQVLDNSDEQVRWHSLSTLRQLAQTTPEVSKGLLKALSDPVVWIRVNAVMALTQFGFLTPEVVQMLLKALVDKNVRIRINAASVLGRCSQTRPDVAQALLEVFDDPQPRVRMVVASALGQLEQITPEIVQALLKALCDPDTRVRANAVSVLGSFGLRGQVIPEVVPALLRTLDDPKAQVRRNVVGTLSRLRQTTPEVIQGLLKALGDPATQVRENAVGGLSQLGFLTPEVIHMLVKALDNPKARIRMNVASVLGSCLQTTPEVVQALLKAMNDLEPRVRMNAANVLGSCLQATPEVVQALLKAMNDPEPRVRMNAVDALGQATPEVTQALKKALGGHNSQIRYSAAISLVKLGDATPDLLPTLVEGLQKSKLQPSRRDAARVLGKNYIEREDVREALYGQLLDTNNESRDVCIHMLVSWGRMSDNNRRLIKQWFRQVIENYELENTGDVRGRSGRDYAYDGLWALVVDTENNNEILWDTISTMRANVSTIEYIC